MYFLPAHSTAPFVCPTCTKKTTCKGRVFEEVGPERLSTLMSWHLNCGHIVHTNLWGRSFGRPEVTFYRKVGDRANASHV